MQLIEAQIGNLVVTLARVTAELEAAKHGQL